MRMSWQGKCGGGGGGKGRLSFKGGRVEGIRNSQSVLPTFSGGKGRKRRGESLRDRA